MTGCSGTNRSARVVYLSHQQLVADPDNPRRFYPPEEVAAMAASIQEAGGVDLALLVQPIDEAGSMYQVIDGHVRLAGAQALGPDAPLLKCEVRIGLSRQDKLLIMARTSALWFAKDPISEAHHYRKLLDGDGTRDNPGMKISALARAVGHSDSLINGRLRLLDLDPEIQELYARGQLPKDPKGADALLSIPNPQARIRLAQELAKRRTSLRGMILACDRLRTDLKGQMPRRSHQPPSLAILDESGAAPRKNVPGLLSGVRSAAAEACGACDVHQESLRHVAEPAWALVSHSAGDTCGNCSLAEVHGACGGCPLPEFLMRLTKAATFPVAPPMMVVAGGNGQPKARGRK